MTYFRDPDLVGQMPSTMYEMRQNRVGIPFAGPSSDKSRGLDKSKYSTTLGWMEWLSLLCTVQCERLHSLDSWAIHGTDASPMMTVEQPDQR